MATVGEILKPFAWLAVLGFLVGFGGYVAVGGPVRAQAAEQAQTASLTSGPASDEWNLPKHI